MTKSVLTLIAPHDKEKLTGQRCFTPIISKYFRLLVPALLLWGCTTESSWVRDGSTIDDYNQDSTACRGAATRSISRNDLPSDIHARIDACMRGHGWHKVNTAEAEEWLKASPARKTYFANIKASFNDYAIEKHHCDTKVATKEIKNYTAYSECADKNLGAIFERHHISGEIADKIRERNAEIAVKLNAGQMTLPQASNDITTYINQLLKDNAPQ